MHDFWFPQDLSCPCIHGGLFPGHLADTKVQRVPFIKWHRSTHTVGPLHLLHSQLWIKNCTWIYSGGRGGNPCISVPAQVRPMCPKVNCILIGRIHGVHIRTFFEFNKVKLSANARPRTVTHSTFCCMLLKAFSVCSSWSAWCWYAKLSYHGPNFGFYVILTVRNCIKYQLCF